MQNMRLFRRKIERGITLFLVIIWMVSVFLFSAQNGEKSLETSSTFIETVESIVTGNQDKEPSQEEHEHYSDQFQNFVRKNAHYILYCVGGFILSTFFYSLFSSYNRIMFCSFVTGSIYAFLDELHQKFVPGRTSRLTDVGIDTLGIATGIILFVFIIEIVRKKKKMFLSGGIKMSKYNEAQDYKILSIETDKKILENKVIQFEEKEVLNQKEKYDLHTVTYSFLKRAIDVTASATALVVLSPIFLVTSLAIRKDSEGPAMFTQKRIGKDGKLFELYKFRTMVPDADKKLFEMLENDEQVREEYKVNKKLKNDPRITKVGGFLRKTSIDELPQLINVLKGDMSLVGPRPYLPREKEDMGSYYDTIIESKPGITGLWQVSGRSNTTFEERMEFDKEYNEHKGFAYDMGLLFKTVGAVIKKDGAE